MSKEENKIIHNSAYAFTRVVAEGAAGEQFNAFLHHNDDVEGGHTHASVNVESLKISIALIYADGTKATLNEAEIERASVHLQRHAKALKVRETVTIEVEESDHDDSLEDRISRISADWQSFNGDDYWFMPWIVAYYDDSIVTHEEGRYFRYDLTEEGDKFSFANRREVLRRFVDVGTVEEGALTPNAIPIDLGEVLGNITDKTAVLEDAEVKVVHAYVHEEHAKNLTALGEAHNILAKELDNRNITHESGDNALDTEADHLSNSTTKKDKKKVKKD